MTNIVQQVWKILDKSPCIRRNMHNGLINYRALARYIIEEKEVDATLDAALGAIRRYQLDKYDDMLSTAHKMFSKTISLSTKSKLVEISLVKDADVQQTLPKLFDIINYVKGDILRIIQANEAIKLWIDDENLRCVKELFPQDKIISINRDIAEISMLIPPKMLMTPGILAIVTNELAINGVNVIETLTCSREMLWFVKEEDLLKAYNVLYQLCNPDKKSGFMGK